MKEKPRMNADGADKRGWAADEHGPARSRKEEQNPAISLADSLITGVKSRGVVQRYSRM